jgi:hypothetical protein
MSESPPDEARKRRGWEKIQRTRGTRSRQAAAAPHSLKDPGGAPQGAVSSRAEPA